MVKLALLIGLNYSNDEKYKLNGSYNDVLLMKEHLINHENFNTDNILILTDKIGYNTQLNATYSNIVNRIQEMINISTKNDILFFYFSGHGSQINDLNNDENDKKDEVFIPSDYNNNIITDDLLKSLFSTSSSTIFSIFDCCSSGTMTDLKYNYTFSPHQLTNKLTQKEEGKMISISSCQQNTDSYEIQFNDLDNKFYSIFTYNLVKHLTKNKETFDSLMNSLKNNILFKNITISFSNLKIKDTTLFDIYIPIIDANSKDINNNNNDVDRMNRLTKKYKKMEKLVQNKNLLISKYKIALNIKDSNQFSPFNQLLYSVHQKNL
tara:strand:- start:4799 stop:5764 length:966 start_codon:yes stop_codon:yes gene_type:complete